VWRRLCREAAVAGLDPLVEEALVAVLAIGALTAVIALLYWLSTGLSPWPLVILAEIAAFGTGIAVLLATSPRRHR
jgi:hypothetical protein